MKQLVQLTASVFSQQNFKSGDGGGVEQDNHHDNEYFDSSINMESKSRGSLGQQSKRNT